MEAIHLKMGKGASNGVIQPGDVNYSEGEIVREGLMGNHLLEIHYVWGKETSPFASYI